MTGRHLFVRIDQADAEKMRDVPGLAALLARYEEGVRDADEHADTIEAARARYATDDIEIDDQPSVSIGDDGVWVSAWVFVRVADPDDEP